MFEMIGSRIKIALLLALFLSPVIASAWSKQLDEWLRSDHTFAAFENVDGNELSR